MHNVLWHCIRASSAWPSHLVYCKGKGEPHLRPTLRRAPPLLSPPSDGLVRDDMSGSMYVYSDESLYEVTVLQEQRDMWRVYLQQHDWEAALRLCSGGAQRDEVHCSWAEAAMSAGDLATAAVHWAKVGGKDRRPCLSPPTPRTCPVPIPAPVPATALATHPMCALLMIPGGGEQPCPCHSSDCVCPNSRWWGAAPASRRWHSSSSTSAARTTLPPVAGGGAAGGWRAGRSVRTPLRCSY